MVGVGPLWALCRYFLFEVDSGNIGLLYTISLSQKTLVGPSIGAPHICSLYLRASLSSTSVFVEQISAPNIVDSTVGWRLLYQRIFDFSQNMCTPVWMCLFHPTSIRSTSTNIDMGIGGPLG